MDGCAEYFRVCEDALALKLAGMRYELAAAMPQAAVLALQALRKRGLQPERNHAGQKVLINGASGGVGSFAIPMAKLSGAKVTGVCSTKKMDYIRELGADHSIDYTQEDFTKSERQYDLILDVCGYHSIFDYLRTLSPGGIYVMVGGSSVLALQVMLWGPIISMLGSKKLGLLLHKPNTDDLNLINRLYEAGKVIPVIDKCFPLSKVAEAMRYYGQGHAKGKVIITMARYS